MQVGLVKRGAVDGDPAVRVAADHAVAADADDAFDQILLVRGGQQADERQQFLPLFDDRRVVPEAGRLLIFQPAARVLEDDHVTAGGLGAEPGGELVHQHPVVDTDGLFHGTGGDDEGLDEERLQHQCDEEGDAD